MEDFVLQSNDCPSCAPYLRAYMIELGVTFGRKIEDAIAKVSLLSYRCPCSCIIVVGSFTQGCFREIG